MLDASVLARDQPPPVSHGRIRQVPSNTPLHSFAVWGGEYNKPVISTKSTYYGFTTEKSLLDPAFISLLLFGYLFEEIPRL